MKRTILICSLASLLFAACGNAEHKKTKKHEARSPVSKPLSKKSNQHDSLQQRGQQILSALKAQDYRAFSKYFSQKGVYFAPYAFIDTANCKHLTAADLVKAIDKNWILTWGSYDGTGNPIKINVKEYLKKFVYNADYLKADTVTYNNVSQTGNSLLKISDVFPGHAFIDYHFSGFDDRYKGMDWTSLILVFKKENNDYHLLAVIHNQWTI